MMPESLTENEEKRRLPWTPSENQEGYCLIKERITQAFRHFKESTERHVLAQFWAPVKNGDQCLLTTSGQPFALDSNSNSLHQYRMIYLTYLFSVDGESDGALGLPARVFRHKLPESTPNVHYYSSREYPRLDHALHYNVRGTLALPVFEPSGQSCVGVLELVMTSQKINYAPKLDKICKRNFPAMCWGWFLSPAMCWWRNFPATMIVNQQRNLGQRTVSALPPSCKKASGWDVRTHPPMALLAMTQEIKLLGWFQGGKSYPPLGAKPLLYSVRKHGTAWLVDPIVMIVAHRQSNHDISGVRRRLSGRYLGSGRRRTL